MIELGLRLLGPEVRTGSLVHAYHVPLEGFMAPDLTPTVLKGLRRDYGETAVAALAKLCASLDDRTLRWRAELVRGDPRSAILVAARQHPSDLIAVGTHGRTGVTHALLGSMAEWVIRAADCDVMVARPARVSFELP
ncbi:MAG: universal stress protein [Myxococcaceae bacterium]|nr:MAG: universal stress protein [Myxococcaceae bacterium]